MAFLREYRIRFLLAFPLKNSGTSFRTRDMSGGKNSIDAPTKQRDVV
jgi:hypothetical protein